MRPLALLLGSGISTPSVPGVEKIAIAIRKSLDVGDRQEYDEYLSAASSSGEKYQRAFQFLSLRRPREYLDRIIASAVLSAYKKDGNTPERRLNGEELYAAEIDTDSWMLPPGQAALGRIWAGLPAHLRGPVITTNFDPLFEVSLRRAGMPASTHIIDRDGSLQQAPQLSESAAVMHIHGFWREGATLSRMSELSGARPLLSASLRALLTRHTLIVLGYSGWNDVVTNALDAVVSEASRDTLDILWCSYGQAPNLRTTIDDSRVLSRLERSPSVTFYSGCDANAWIPDIEMSVAEYLRYGDNSRSSASRSSITGFDLVDPAQHGDQSKQDLESRALSFLDGREPAIRDGFNPLIASLDAVPTAHNQLAARIANGVPTLTFITGAAGEGKSTVACQLAARLSKVDANAVLYSRNEKFSPDAVLTASTNQQTVIVLDHAHESFGQLRALAQKLNDESPRPLHIIAVARDTDWASVGGFRFPWARYLDYKSYRLKGLTHLDASSIVRSWEQLGERALGDLASKPSFDAKVSELIRLSRSGDGESSTLFGASLEIRYGGGLRSHVRELVLRLSDILSDAPSANSGVRESSLAYPLFLASIPQIYGNAGVPKRVLARALALSKIELDTLVLRALGDEAPLSVSGSHVYARHRAIAEAIIDVSAEEGFSLGDAVSRLVKAAVSLIEEDGYSPELIDVAYISRNIPDRELATLAAEAAYDECPARLSYSARLSSSYRRADRVEDAIDLGEHAISTSWQAPDRETSLRIALNEYGVALGSKDRFVENVHYGLLSIADIPGVPIHSASDMEYPLSCLGLAGCNAWETTQNHGFASGVASVLFLIDELDLVGVKPDWARRYRSVVRHSGEKWVTNVDEAIAGLAGMVDASSESFATEVVRGLPKKLHFSALEAVLYDLSAR
ncbi:P-loop NTPase [Brachybacterium subflavum]|uniref:P-loop NTPase n=1 Tax=Brachybacterium subflavum TaxID=2585206 RepID=UPI0012666767|nr:SIR2 family protein [Brachybacterium subflavum]